MAKDNHTHKIMKVGPIWKCVLGCSWFIYFKQDYVILGRDFQCWTCGNTFKLDREAMELEHPICESCRHPELDDIDKFLANKGV